MAESSESSGAVMGAVLSGGLSSRMGRPKDRVLLPDGRSMMQHVADAVLSVCNELVVAGPDLSLDLGINQKVYFIEDNYPGSGPLGGIEAILSSGLARAYIIAACDQPLLSGEILSMLIPDDLLKPCFFQRAENGFIEPLPGYYPVSMLAEVRELLSQNRRALKSLTASIDVQLRSLEERFAKSLFSLNNPDELNEISGQFFPARESLK